MTNSSGTPGGVGSPQGGQQGWDDAENAQPIPPSREGTTSAGMTGTVYDPSKETQMATKTDAEKAAEAEAKAKADKNAEAKQSASGSQSGVAPKEGEDRTYPAVDTDPTDPSSQPNFGLPEGVSTSATRGENKSDRDVEPVNPEGEPNPTVEEQLGTDTDEDDEALKEG